MRFFVAERAAERPLLVDATGELRGFFAEAFFSHLSATADSTRPPPNLCAPGHHELEVSPEAGAPVETASAPSSRAFCLAFSLRASSSVKGTPSSERSFGLEGRAAGSFSTGVDDVGGTDSRAFFSASFRLFASCCSPNALTRSRQFWRFCGQEARR